jgi:hypothetical protein
MKPSNHNIAYSAKWATLWVIPMAIYCAALGPQFVLGLLGFSILAHTMNRIVNGILPVPKGKKS